MNLFLHRKTIGENLHCFILSNNYSILNFSNEVGISRPTIYRILRGQSPNPKIYEKQIEIITNYFGFSKLYLVNYPESQEKSS